MSEYCTTRRFLVNWANLNVSRRSRHCVFFQRSSQKPYFTYYSPCKTYKLSLKPCLLSRSSTCLTLLYSVASWAAGGCHVKSSLCALFLPFPITGWAWFGDTCWKCLAGADVQLIVTLHERGNLDAWNDDLCYDLTYNRKKNQTHGTCYSRTGSTE